MAFCKFCGKQIPDGGACDCAAAKTAAAASEKAENTAEAVKEEAVQAVETVKEEAANTAETVKEEAAKAVEKVEEKVAEVTEKAEEKASEIVNEVRSDSDSAAQNVQQKAENTAQQASNGFKQLSGADIAKKVEGITNSINEKLPENVKKNKSLVYAAAGACVLLLLLIVLCLCSLGGGAKGTVKKYVNNTYSKKGGKTFYSLMLPKASVKELKDEDKFDDLVEDYNDKIEDLIDDLDGKSTVPTFDQISRKVLKGYEVRVKTRSRDEDGDIDHDKDTMCVVKVKGEGWKVIPSSASDIGASAKLLRGILGISSSFMDDEDSGIDFSDIFE